MEKTLTAFDGACICCRIFRYFNKDHFIIEKLKKVRAIRRNVNTMEYIRLIGYSCSYVFCI